MYKIHEHLVLAENRTYDHGSQAPNKKPYSPPWSLGYYLRLHPEIKIGVYQSPIEDIPRRAMDRDVQVGFVKEKPVFRN
jgi:hypothetical protein